MPNIGVDFDCNEWNQYNNLINWCDVIKTTWNLLSWCWSDEHKWSCYLDSNKNTLSCFQRACSCSYTCTYTCEHRHTHTAYQYSISTYNNITITKPSFGFPPLIFTHYIHHYRSSLSRTGRWCQLLFSLPPCLAQWNRCSPQIDRRLPAVFQTRANKEATNKSSFTAGQDQPHSLPSCSI